MELQHGLTPAFPGFLRPVALLEEKHGQNHQREKAEKRDVSFLCKNTFLNHHWDKGELLLLIVVEVLQICF